MNQHDCIDGGYTCPRCSANYSLRDSRLEGLLPQSFVQGFLIDRGMKAFLWFFIIVGDAVLLTFRGIRCPRCGRLDLKELPEKVRRNYLIMLTGIITVAIVIMVIIVSVPK
jgi:DNA-directed RNA polymerase subunit RPC12/RpoP